MTRAFVPPTQAALYHAGRRINGNNIGELLAELNVSELCIAHHYRGKTLEALSIEDKWDFENYASEIRSGHIKHIAFYAVRRSVWKN